VRIHIFDADFAIVRCSMLRAFFYLNFTLAALSVRKKLVLYFYGKAERFTKVMSFKPK
jgi:hypothetical protein